MSGEITIPTYRIERLVREGKLVREMEGDSFTGRVILDFREVNGKIYYYRQFNKKYYVREE
jgi:hypothetical protein